MKAGRPLIFESPEALQEKIEAYFAHCDAGEEYTEITKRGEVVKIQREIPYTMEGLADYLDVDGETIRNYQKRDGFFGVISRARNKIHASWIKHGMLGHFNPKVVSLALMASCRDYQPTQEVNHRSSTVEDIIKRIGQGSSASTKRIEDQSQDDDTVDGEVIE